MSDGAEQRFTREARQQITGTARSARGLERLPRFLGAAYYGSLNSRPGEPTAPATGRPKGESEDRDRDEDGGWVLVTYASKMGSTREIAESVADEMAKAGLVVDVRSVEEVSDVGPYTAVVVGSALYMARWRRPAVYFLRRHARALRDRPVWLFHSGPVGDTGTQGGRPSHPAPSNVRRLAARIGAEQPVTFGGALSRDRARGFVARQIVARGVSGDSRDFDDIRAWAREVARQIARTAPQR